MIKISSMGRIKNIRKTCFVKKKTQKSQLCHCYITTTIKELAKFIIMLFLQNTTSFPFSTCIIYGFAFKLIFKKSIKYFHTL
jgi:hypothetical protein